MKLWKSWHEGWNYEITKKDLQTITEIEKNYKICRQVYNLLFKSIGKNFHDYLRTLDFVELEELNADIKINS